VFSGFANTRLATGDAIEVMPPEGRFGAALGAGTYVGIAAGSGITPVLSLLKAVLAGDERARFVLLYGSRTTASILFRGELEDLKDRYLERLSVIHVLSREGQDVPVLSGRLEAAKLRALLPAAGVITAAFVCGPGEMIETAEGVLAELGVADSRVHVERFTPSSPPRGKAGVADVAPFGTATIIHDGKTNLIEVAEGEPILEAAIRAGLDLPWSCRGGMCSTCRARVTEGAATMEANYSLEPWETAAGFVLTCQAHPTSRHVIVDYDAV
jgi:ring-1,2-phenylacetyl-CoA epoxidase subunit PaaE